MRPAATSPWRLRRVLAWLGLGLVGLVALGAAALRWRTHRLGDALVEELRALEEVDPRREPHHAEPGAPSLAQALRPLLPGLTRRETEAVDATRAAGCLGKPEPAVNRECLAATPELRARARALLASTRTPVGDLPDEVVMDRDTGDVGGFEAVAPLSRAVKIAALEVAERAAAEDADAALDTCADALALARDEARLGGFQGAVLGSSWVALVRAPCALALDAASHDAKLRFAAACELFAAQWPTQERVARSTAARELFHLYGDLLSQEQMQRLPPAAARGLLQRRLPPAGAPFLSLRHHAWATHASALRVAVSAVDADGSVAAPRLVRARDLLASSWNPALRTRSLVVDEVLERNQRARVLLQLLAFAARADAGESPRLGPELLVRPEGGGRAVRPRQARWAAHETVFTPGPP